MSTIHLLISVLELTPNFTQDVIYLLHHDFLNFLGQGSLSRLAQGRNLITCPLVSLCSHHVLGSLHCLLTNFRFLSAYDSVHSGLVSLVTQGTLKITLHERIQQSHSGCVWRSKYSLHDTYHIMLSTKMSALCYRKFLMKVWIMNSMPRLRSKAKSCFLCCDLKPKNCNLY